MTTCKTCAAYKPDIQGKGNCHLVPPAVLFAGLMPSPIGGQPQPILLSAHPTVNPASFCMQWQPKAAPDLEPFVPPVLGEVSSINGGKTDPA